MPTMNLNIMIILNIIANQMKSSMKSAILNAPLIIQLWDHLGQDHILAPKNKELFAPRVNLALQVITYFINAFNSENACLD